MTETEHLRVLIANEKRDRLELLARVVAGLGHEASGVAAALVADRR